MAANPYLPDDVAFGLMDNVDLFVRLQLASNPEVPDLALRRLQRDPDTDVRQMAERALFAREGATRAAAEKEKPRGRRRRRRR